MIYQEFQPRAALAPFVRCLWVMEGEAHAQTNEPERVVPDGCVEAIVHYGDAFQSSRDGINYQTGPHAIVAGQITGCLSLRACGKIGMAGVRFHPAGAHHFFRTRMSELADRIVGLDVFWGAESGMLESRIAAARTPGARAKAFEDFLCGRVCSEPPVPGFVPRAIDAIIGSRGRIPIAEVARTAGVTPRHLERTFDRQVGIGPKLLARIVRLRGLLAQASNRGAGAWADLAERHGYYDQAHLVNEFKTFTGRSPTAYFREASPMGTLLIGATPN